MINKILHIGNKIDLKIGDINFKGVPENLSSSFLKRLVFIVEGKYNIVNFSGEGKIFDFDESRKLYDITGNILLIEYSDKNVIEKDIKILNENSSIVLNNGMQVPEIFGTFIYNGKEYLILKANNKIINEKSNFSYNGVIVNPELYFGKIGKERGEVKNEIDNILK